jgi:outer membrane protein OmpA-like peptidoglycan-associated protein
MRPLVAAALILMASDLAHAQDSQFRVLDANFRVFDLEFRVLGLDLPEQEVAAKVTDLTMRETETELRIELSADVLFDFDKSDIRAEAADALKRLATILREHAGRPVRIEGHTDSKGSDAYNRALSEDRALSVRDWLAEEEGLELGKASIVGHGEAQPAAPNENPDGSDNPEGRQKNRRVEIIIGK